MHLFVNAVPREVAEASTVADLVRDLGLPDRGVAVAVDDAVVPRGRWDTTQLKAAQHIEVLTAVQGG